MNIYIRTDITYTIITKYQDKPTLSIRVAGTLPVISIFIGAQLSIGFWTAIHFILKFNWRALGIHNDTIISSQGTLTAAHAIIQGKRMVGRTDN